MRIYERNSLQTQRGASAFGGIATVATLTLLLAIGVHVHRNYAKALATATSLGVPSGTSAIWACGSNPRLRNGVAQRSQLVHSPCPRATARDRRALVIDESTSSNSRDLEPGTAFLAPGGEPAQVDPAQAIMLEGSLARRLLESF